MEHGHCSSCDIHNEHSVQQYTALMHKTIVAGILGTVLLVVYMFGIMPELTANYGFVTNASVALIVLVALIYCGGQYFAGAWHAFLKHAATMDTLIALGTGSAWIYSCVVLFFTNSFPPAAQHVYFEATIVIIALVNLGMLLDARARKQTSTAIRQLMNLQPQTAYLIRNNKDVEVTIDSLQIDDLIRVRPGARIPVDGIITEGRGVIDESMLTGEPLPQQKDLDDVVTGGTINTSGSFIFKATKVGKDTTLAQIVELVEHAQNSKPQLARLADSIAQVFVPIVMIIAVITALTWYNLGIEPVGTYMFITSVSILVIACPCALGLAVPISVMLGIGKAARYGILIRNANALQQMSKLSTVVLDKTGTITVGRPRVIDVLPMPHCEIKTILKLAASLEFHSEHPYAQAIIRAAHSAQMDELEVTNFQSIAGLGISGDINGEPVAIGNAGFMSAQLISIDALHKQAQQNAEHGQTFVFVARNKQLIGGISIADPVRDDAKDLIEKLQNRGLKVIMITGDTYATAQAVAKRVGIKDVIAGVMPQEKVAQIVKLQEDDHVVAMVGDGINDAPALAQANVGFAIGSGTDIAMQSADVTIITANLLSIFTAIDLANKTVKNMRQNLFAAFIYNIIGIPIAAGILFPLLGTLLNPMLASCAMALSSLTVVLNANRLRMYKPEVENHAD